jgi:hypothetical protein
VLNKAIAVKPSLKLSRRPRLADWGEYAAAVYEVMGWDAETFLTDWDEVVKVQNQTTLDGSPVAQAIIKFMEDKEEYTTTASELHKKLGSVAEVIGVERDRAWPKSARWLWKRIKEVLPLVVAAGIDASREHTDKGTAIALRKAPKSNVSNIRESKSSKDKAKIPDITDGLMSGSNVREDSNVRTNVSHEPAIHVASDVTDNTDIRDGNSWSGDPMRHYSWEERHNEGRSGSGGQDGEERSTMSEQPSYEDILHSLRVRLAGNPRLRDLPAEDISDDLADHSHLPTKPDPELVSRALQEIDRDEGSGQ